MADRPHPRPPPPRHLKQAVAVRYQAGMDQAPRLLAKGQGSMAERIIAVAQAHGIPLHDDRDLVLMLGLLDLDVEIPPTLYRALAEVLAHLYRANARAEAANRPAPRGSRPAEPGLRPTAD